MSFLEDFKKFALRGNLVDLAIGFTVGAAFSTVAKSLVDDIIMPPIGMVLGNADFSDLFVVLADGDKAAPPYSTLKDAQTAGAVTLNYGQFVNHVVALLLVALAMFLLIRLINRIDDQLDDYWGTEPNAAPPSTKKCKYCRTAIDYQATRCPNCTSELPEPESRSTTLATTS